MSFLLDHVENGMTVSYVMNRMRGEGDLRAPKVIFAAHASMKSLTR